ncbi:hypothetical protein HN51_045399 [Arachis hypogaea]
MRVEEGGREERERIREEERHPATTVLPSTITLRVGDKRSEKGRGWRVRVEEGGRENEREDRYLQMRTCETVTKME